MTALQVIDEIKALSPQERAKVLEALREWEGEKRQEGADEAKFRATVDQVLDRHADLMRKLAQ